jgi:hypothetical protein
MPARADIYKIDIDGKWELKDLHSFAYAYTQVYSLLYSIAEGKNVQTTIDKESEENPDEIIEYESRTAYTRYPWRGGYSVFDFYQELYYSIPPSNRPKIKSISYASPGWLELTLVTGIALSIEKIVKSIARSVETIYKTVDRIHSRAQKRKLLRATTRNKEFELTAEDIRFLRDSSEELARLMGFDSLEQLHKFTGDPLVSFKILLSFYRRVRPLADYQNHRQIKF